MAGDYVITRSSEKSGLAFLMDRTYQKKKWWSSRLGNAMRFHSEIAANKICDRLKFGNPRVERFDYINEDLYG